MLRLRCTAAGADDWNSHTSSGTPPTGSSGSAAISAVAKRSSYLQVVFEGFAFLLGIVLSAAFLLVRLFKGVQEASQAKQLLKQEQELSDLVINNISNQGIVMFDSQLRCLLWNPGMEDLLNIKPDQAVGQRMQDLDRLFARTRLSER